MFALLKQEPKIEVNNNLPTKEEGQENKENAIEVKNNH